MKLRRFIALDTQRAIMMVHKKLGPDALVYSTRKVANGIEILAGMPSVEETTDNSHEVDVVEKSNVDRDTIDKLNLQLQMMESSIERLSQHVMTLYQAVSVAAEKKKTRYWNWNFFKGLTRIKKQLMEGRYGRQTAH